MKETEWRAGKGGREHLWGIPELRDRGFEIDILPFRSASARCSPRWGNSAQQAEIIRRYRRFDALFLGAQPLVNGLALLRAGGLFRKPIVAICHHGLPGGRIPSLYARGFDHLIFLSRRIAEMTVQQHPVLRRRWSVLEWGFDLEYHRASSDPGPLLVASGKTCRDYDTLCSALGRAPVPTQIFCSADSAPRMVPPPCVTIAAGGYNRNAISDSEMQRWYSKSFAVAVPLQDQPFLLGLTSLLDAMVHGKAVMVTKTPYLDIDVDAEGCGISVMPGDIDGWVAAIRYLNAHPGRAKQMGIRGRELCEKRYNINAFGAQVARIFETLRA